MYAVINVKSRREVSRFDTPEEALEAIKTYKKLDSDVFGEECEYAVVPVKDDHPGSDPSSGNRKGTASQAPGKKRSRKKADVRKMRIYISGKISGREEEARAEFAAAKAYLDRIGHEAVNPFDNGLSVDDTWERHLAVDIRDLLTCDAVCQLPGWEDSRGARLEAEVALVHDIPVIPSTSFSLGRRQKTE